MGLSLQPAKCEIIRQPHRRCPARGDASLCLLRGLLPNPCTDPGKPPEEALRSIRSSSCSSLVESTAELLQEELFTSSFIVRGSLLALLRCGVENGVMMIVIHTVTGSISTSMH